MALKKPLLVLACLFGVVLPIALATCPSKEDVAPCTCRESTGGADIKCGNIGDKELAKVASSLRGTRVDKIFIQDSKLGFIQHDVFKGVQLKKLEIYKSTLSALTDTSEAFVGLEDQLESLRIWYCAYKNAWDWSVLKNLKKLKSLTIIDSLHLETLGSDVMTASISSNLEHFFFSGNDVSFVSDHAFDSFKNLRQLTLRDNKVKNVKRTMLPNPALTLTYLAITSSLIEQFPEDMFTNMPNLQRLDIRENKIQVLNERTFSPVWEQLQSLFLYDNPLRCDCSMSWITKKKAANGLYGECASPPELQGKKLAELTSKDFVC